MGAVLALGPGCKKEVEIPKSVLEAEVEPLEEVNADPEPVVMEVRRAEPVIDKSAKVAVLGYHDFTLKGLPTEMKIRAEKFHNQMQALKDARIPVIPLSDYLAWRREEKPIPAECAVITIDDGWVETHTYAMPILKEFGYPFTIYIYTKFLNNGGRTLSNEQVKELLASGAELGSHSVSHELMTARGKFKDDAAYEAWLTDEIVNSKKILEERFGVTVNSFAYPFGGYNERIRQMIEDAGYTSAVTVNGAKSDFETPLQEIPRFIIHGADDSNWKLGTTFRSTSVISDENNLLKPAPLEGEVAAESPVKTWPSEGEVVKSRTPLIRVDFSGLPGVDPASFEMNVSGFGRVKPDFDADRNLLYWQVPRKLRMESCSVSVKLRRTGQPKADVVAWSFRIDRNAYFLTPPGESGETEAAVPVTATRAAEPVHAALPTTVPES